ncbi:hypothetical protein COB52_04190 [Candidatus Kaiserbacteria bacterium]|nr:MAG: hypothetical protein COB52_04190 [Candidatus Kaiserbacteria bacterium]
MGKTVPEILDELRSDNGSNFKMDVLKKYADNELLQMVLKMAYDKVIYTYGITMKNMPDDITITTNKISLEAGLKFLRDDFATRNFTGNAAHERLEKILANMRPDNFIIITQILDRSLKINMGRSNINKVFKGLIVKPVYMRCGIYSEDKMIDGKLKKETAGKVNPKGAIVQLKADGTYREATVLDSKASYVTRQGEEHNYPVLDKILKHMWPGKYFGELTVVLDAKLLDEILPKIHKEDPVMAADIAKNFYKDRKTLPRSIGNGLINSDNPPHDNIVYEMWDYVTFEEYANAANKVKNTVSYYRRLDQLIDSVSEGNETAHDDDHVTVIETHRVDSVAEALVHTANWMKDGLEGSIYKDKDAVFRDGTSLQQLKLKLEITIGVRIIGFLPGNKGSKNEAYFSAITFESDDGKIKGQVGVTTLTEKLRDWFHVNRQVVGPIMNVQCNDLTKGRDNDFYALSHPRYDEIRTDLDVTDTLERAFESRNSAMMLDAA